MLPFSSLPSSGVIWTVYVSVAAVSVMTHAAHCYLAEYRHHRRMINTRLQRLAAGGGRW
jgi:hypothetical protein